MDNVYKGFSFFVYLTIVTLMLIATFLLGTAGLHQAIVSISTVVDSDWCITILALGKWVSIQSTVGSESTADREGSVSSSQNANSLCTAAPPLKKFF